MFSCSLQWACGFQLFWQGAVAGGGEVYGALCFCVGAITLYQLRALDLAARGRRLLPAAGAGTPPAHAAMCHRPSL